MIPADCRHDYPMEVVPWDPKKVRCRKCARPAPERIVKAVYNATVSRRIRRAIRARWSEGVMS